MALRNIVTNDQEFLGKKSRPVTAFDEKLATLVNDMRETLDKAQGMGLAAPQVGILRRYCVIDVGEGIIELINPVIVSTEGEQCDQEGCLSFPGEYGMVSRPEKVTVRAQNRNGENFTITGEGLLARALCHEIDHLDGIVYKDRLVK